MLHWPHVARAREEGTDLQEEAEVFDKTQLDRNKVTRTDQKLHVI